MLTAGSQFHGTQVADLSETCPGFLRKTPKKPGEQWEKPAFCLPFGCDETPNATFMEN